MKTFPRLPLALCALALLAASARAETITVNSLLDLPDADPFDGVCDSDLLAEGLQCTLRAAIQHANATAGPDDVVLPAGIFKLTSKGPTEDGATTGDLDLIGDVTITGAGQGVTVIDAVKLKDRVFDVLAGSNATISSLSMIRGKAPKTESGGGIRNNGTLTVTEVVVDRCVTSEDGAGIDSESGSIVLTRVVVSRCRSRDDGAGVEVDTGSATLDSCAIFSNKSGDEGGGLEISENSGTPATLVNCTISRNKAKKNAGGISLEDGGSVSLLNCTVAFNKAPKAAGISVTDDEFGANTCTVQNSILTNGKKCADRALTSLGGNIDRKESCGFTQLGDLSNVDPRLRPLATNGGNTLTHAIAEDSPAQGLGTVNCPQFDQRGRFRSVPCDSGAYDDNPQLTKK